mgnify:CR=1 FL=1
MLTVEEELNGRVEQKFGQINGLAKPKDRLISFVELVISTVFQNVPFSYKPIFLAHLSAGEFNFDYSQI